MKKALWINFLLMAMSVGAQPGEVRKTVQQFYRAFNQADTTALADLVSDDLEVHLVENEGVVKMDRNQLMVRLNQMADFYEYDGSFHIEMSGPLATAASDYTFYLHDTVHHCGTNFFQLKKTGGSWKVARVDYSSRSDCAIALKREIHNFIDAWHAAAARADEDVFFGSMTADAIYIGTDPSERWYRDELKAWSAAYFDAEAAWDFKAIERHIYLSDEQNVVWFEELLDTWMGPCRGSGVLLQTEDGFKIRHYVLSVTVPNEKIDDFKKALEIK